MLRWDAPVFSCRLWLSGGRYYSIAEDNRGAIWIGAETAVYRFSNGRVEEISKGVAIGVIVATPDVVVAAMGPPDRGIPAKASLVRIQRLGNTWRTETVMSLDAPGPLTLDHAGLLLYVWPGQGWNELRLDDIVRWRPAEQLPVKHNPTTRAPSAGPMRVLRDRFGCIWIGTEAQANSDCGDNSWPLVPFVGARAGQNFQEAPDGAMVLVGYNILTVGRPGSFRVAKLANGLPQLFRIGCTEWGGQLTTYANLRGR